MSNLFYVYILELEGDKFYVGMARNLIDRLRQHFIGQGSIPTRLNAPIRVVSSHRTFSRTDAYDLESRFVSVMWNAGLMTFGGGWTIKNGVRVYRKVDHHKPNCHCRGCGNA